MKYVISTLKHRVLSRVDLISNINLLKVRALLSHLLKFSELQFLQLINKDNNKILRGLYASKILHRECLEPYLAFCKRLINDISM